LILTTDVDTNPEPVTVIETPEEPTIKVLGDKLIIDGFGFLTVSNCAELVPPPGAALVTDTLTVPAEAITESAIVVVSLVELQ
jgi:hypothetical protein